ncbi:MAG: flagellin, partial [Inhella sp.]
ADDIKTVIQNIDKALDTVNGERSTYGAVHNRFEAVISALMVAYENQTAARSRIMDADFAVETANLSRANILQQAGNSRVAQANALPQGVLALLRG